MTDKHKKEENKQEKKSIFGHKDKKVTITEKEYKELQKAVEEKDKNWEKYLRLYAEYENAKKLWQKQKEEFLKFGNFRLLKELVSLYDEIKIAFSSLANIDAQHKKGMDMIEKRIEGILQQENVKVMEVKGKIFDPYKHEVLGMEENEELEENTVIDVFQDGYIYEDKVLRPAKVKVSRKAAKAVSEVSSPEGGKKEENGTEDNNDNNDKSNYEEI